MLNQILRTSSRSDQKRQKSARYRGRASICRVTVQCTVTLCPAMCFKMRS